MATNLTLTVFNAAFHKGERHGERILARAAAIPTDVLLGVECKRLDLTDDDAPPLDPNVWEYLHDRREGPDEAGNLIAVRRERGRILSVRYDVLAPAGGGTLTRHALTAWTVFDEGTGEERVRKLTVGHMPPPRSGPARWEAAADVLRELRPDVAAADWNRDGDGVASAFPHRVTPVVEVMGFTVRRPLEVAALAKHDVGSDHPAVTLTLIDYTPQQLAAELDGFVEELPDPVRARFTRTRRP